MSVKLGIRGKFFLVSLAFIAVVDVMIGVALDHQLRGVLQSRISDELGRHVRSARDGFELAQLPPTIEAVDAVADRVGRSMDARVTVVDPEGVVLGDSVLDSAAVAAMESHAQRPEIVAALANGEGRSERFSTTLDTEMTYIAVPLYDDGSVIRVGLTMDNVQETLAGLRTLVVLTGVLTSLAAALLAALASEFLSRSLRRLITRAHAIASNPAEIARLPEQATELGGLAGSFNSLVDELERTMGTNAAERHRFGTVLDTMDHAVVALDDEGRLTLVNRHARQMMKLPEAVVGRPLLDYVRVPELHDLVSAAADSKAASGEFEYGATPRHKIRAHVTGQDAGGVVIVMHDVTEIRKLERIRKDFVANVSHELQTPIAVIRANTETLLAGALDHPERSVEFVQAVHRHAERLGRLVADLLDISRIEAGQYAMDVQSVDLDEMVDCTIEGLATEAAARKMEVRRGFDDAPSVLADDNALEQVLVNLVGNAIQYSDGGREVEVAIVDQDSLVRIEVRDDGPGIDPKHHKRVFERFYRVDSGRAREKGGTGLGLAIVKHLVDAMGGSVGVDARRPRGSTFWFTLPKAPR